MTTQKDVAYSLFGGPLILDVGPGLNGEIIRVRVQPINTISVTALVISLLLFITFMWFYLYPLFSARRALATSERARTSDAEQPVSPGMPLDEAEKSNLLSWLHLRSRDRFSTHDSPISKQSSKSERPVPTLPGLNRQPSSFTRGSLIPHLSPGTLTPPPPAYASRPSSPLAMGDFRFPSPLSSPRPEGSRSPRTPSLSLLSPALPASIAPGPASPRASATPQVQFDPCMPSPSRPSPPSPAQGRGRSGTGPPSTTLAVRPLMAPRRSVSDNTLHPVSAALHVPSRARVYTAGESDHGASVGRIPRPRDRDGAGLGLEGIGLAARGRTLTRRPSSGWDRNAVGAPF